MELPLYLLMPLGAAIVFSLATLFIKRAYTEGVSAPRAFLTNNLVLGLTFLPMLALDSRPFLWSKIHHPLLTGLAFFIGQVANFLAIRFADVSLVVPLLGTKVVFVALFSVVLFGVPLQPEHWWAAGLTMVSVLILGATDMKVKRGLGAGTLLAMFSGACFGLCDAQLQQWAGEFGLFHFLPVSLGLVAVLSVALTSLSWKPGPPVSRIAGRWLAGAAAFTALQAVLISVAVGKYHDATGANVVYSTRGLWSIALVWFVGDALGNQERQAGGKKMFWRITGALLMTAAVVLVIKAGARRHE